ncbi:MAG: 6-phosphofructokinase [Candidatus Methylomirabilis oxygeniifera]|uniref:Pyrophosphate--fructose 6-phosphate 1-phosphotransferase n=1 Tax=Methylomirabilis oxygeniifera TaxID=671143 RepID=D5ML99_METO1|nr:MAG: 6-phosphofructokinase [Candidatus Methylomirabilis oxyfera]CBE67765.1 6-phosphofructokinase [Candidatus Methylomirabilis oxyfera]
MKTLAMLVGGGPAPGINGVIAAATIEARNHGVRVLGFYDGFKWLARGDTGHVIELEIDGISRIHFEGGSILRTSRTNPTKSQETLRNTIEALEKLEVSGLLTIGGDDTAFASYRLSDAVKGRIAVAHVPKTIDNDLPLPQEVATFGFTTACNLGKEIVQNLMDDAETTDRWFFITVMGRRAGHLALGIGGAAGATLTVIGEEFSEPRIPLQTLVDILEGAVIKRRTSGKGHGVAILSEGLADKLDPAEFGSVEQDGYGNVRLSELVLGRVLKERVAESLRARGIDVTIVAKDIGYELRCAPPGALDIQYCRSLGYWATRFLLDGQTEAMVTIQGGKMVPIPFQKMLDHRTGKIRVRYVDIDSESYQTLRAYMIRLEFQDFETSGQIEALARDGHLEPTAFTNRFRYLGERTKGSSQ